MSPYKKPTYTVKHSKKEHYYYSAEPIHGSADLNETICGKIIDDTWMVLSNAFDGDVTCPECIKLLGLFNNI